MLHQIVLRELLEDECASARERLVGRYASLSVESHSIYCRFSVRNVGDYCLRFDGRNYDSEPFRVAAVDSDDQILPPGRWPAGLYHSQHPVLGVPFVCVQGAYEYHTHPSHLADSWDRYRQGTRLADLLAHLLRRCGL